MIARRGPRLFRPHDSETQRHTEREMAEQEIVIRDITDVEEMRAVEELQKEVWGMSDRDIASVLMMRATNAVGGILVGAFDGARLVGFVYGFVGLDAARPIMHSDMLAVKREYRGHDLGRRLKLAQRERVLARGLRLVTWTFDPLQARNAHLNFARLGVVSDRYHVNFYGEHSSSPLHATGTDRLWVSWPIAHDRVRARIQGEGFDEDTTALAHTPALVHFGPGGEPLCEDFEKAEQPRILIEIPGDIGKIEKENPSLALEWRRATRRAFTDALSAGYLVEEFYRSARDGQRIGVYLLTAGRKLEEFLAT
jgi:predicted GNAT superfamily acetyltransferase